MTKELTLTEGALTIQQYVSLSDHFRTFSTGGEWTSLAADSGSSVAAGDTENGILVLTTGATDNNEACVKTTKKWLKFGQDKPNFFEALVQYTEANTDDANVFIGLSSALGADMMVDNGAGPATSFSGCGFYKTDSDPNGNYWKIVVSLGSTQTLATLTAGNSHDQVGHLVDTAQHRFSIKFQPKTSSLADIIFQIDGITVYKVTDFVFTSAVVMYGGVYVKAGGANSEVVNVDAATAAKHV